MHNGILITVDVCECHAAPVRFKTDRRRSHGGYEICSVTERKYVGDVISLPLRAGGEVADVGGYFTRPAATGYRPRSDATLDAYRAIDEYLVLNYTNPPA